MDVYVYGWRQSPYPIAPYNWIKNVLDAALRRGLQPARTYLGIHTYCRHWLDSGWPYYNVTYDQAAQIAPCETWRWMERIGNMTVREKYARTANGYLWLSDGDTLAHRLHLADEFGLAGVMLFIPGVEAEAIWPVIAEWKAGVSPWHGYIGLEDINLGATRFNQLLDIAYSQGRKKDAQPCRITHGRSVSATRHILEAMFRYGELSAQHTKNWLGAVLDVDAVTIDDAGNDDTITFSQGGVDYLKLYLFGGLDSAWMQSGDECRARLATWI